MIFPVGSSSLSTHYEFLLIQRRETPESENVNLDWKVLIQIEKSNFLTKYVANKHDRSLQYFLCQPSLQLDIGVTSCHAAVHGKVR
jgi:hypothetical protein